MTARSGYGGHPSTTLLWFVGAVVVIGGLGLAADQVWGHPETRVAMGRLPEYVGNGFSLLVAVACVATVAVGLTMSVFTALRTAGRAAVSAVRFVRSHSWRYMVAKAAPVALPAAVFVGLALATGGPTAIGFWAVAAVVGATRLGVAARDHLVPKPVGEVEVDRPGEYWTPVPVIGWRAWMWTGAELHGYRQPWTGSEFAARCDTCSEIPGQDHGCGVYAVIDRHQLSAFSRPLSASEVVVGKVELAGLVIEHERGFRAERARIVELWAPPRLVATVSARYPDVPVLDSAMEAQES